MLNTQLSCDRDGKPEWISFGEWLDELGVTSTTGWRWRRKNFVTPVCIQGRLYISKTEISAFWERARRGELAGTSRRWANRNWKF